MDKKELLDGLKFIRHRALDLSLIWKETEQIKKTIDEAYRLISAHGGEAEVGGEEREKLAEHFDHVLATHNDPTKPPCPLCQQIRALLRQPRTVSREWVRELAAIVWNENMGVIEHAIRKKISELGYEVKEKAMSQFTEVAVAEEEK